MTLPWSRVLRSEKHRDMGTCLGTGSSSVEWSHLTSCSFPTPIATLEGVAPVRNVFETVAFCYVLSLNKETDTKSLVPAGTEEFHSRMYLFMQISSFRDKQSLKQRKMVFQCLK